MKSLIVFISFLLFPNFLIAQSIDTFYIPEGYTHFVLGNPRTCFDDLGVVPDTCISLDGDIGYAPGELNANIFVLGNNSYTCVYNNGETTDSCNYNTVVSKGNIDELTPSFEMADKEVILGEQFEVEVFAKNCRDIIDIYLNITWNNEMLEVLDIRFTPDLSNTRTHDYFFAKSDIIASLYIENKTNQPTLDLDDDSVLIRFTFRAIKAGSTSIDFFRKFKDIFGPTSLLILNGNDTIQSNVLLKSGIIKIEEPFVCNVPTITRNATICQGENYILNNQAYNQTGNYRATFTATNGCDSIVDLQLTVIPKSAIETTIQETICEGKNFEGYTQTGTYIDTFKTQNGQDSIRTLELIVDSFVSITCPPNDTFVIPEGFTHISLKNSFFFDTIGFYDNPIIKPTACFAEVERIETGDLHFDQIFGLGSVNVIHRIKNQAIDESCTSSIHIKEGSTTEKLISFSMSDISIEEGTSFCVDIMTANFQKVNAFELGANWDSTALEYVETKYPNIYNGNIPISIIKKTNAVSTIWITDDFINGYTKPDSTILYSLCFKAKKAGQFPINFFSPLDSFLLINEILLADAITTDIWLRSSTVNVEKLCETTMIIQNLSICQGENYILNNQAYNQTGNYQTTLTTANGCDSIINLTLTILPNISNEITVQINEGEIYILNNQAYNQTGNYQATFTATNGCDSIVDLQLTVIPKSGIETTIQETICEGTSFEGYNQTGIYIDTFLTTADTDSIRTLELTIEPNVVTEISAQICQGESYSIENQVYNQAGNYEITLTKSNGCDSIVKLQLAIGETTITNVQAMICEGENYLLNNQAYNQAGNYVITFPSTSGCDSTVQLTLETLPVPSAIADTFSTKENQELFVDITSNDVLPTGVNWQTSIITPPHIGTLVSLENGHFSYVPKFAYTGPTSFEYQICNEVCLPEGCTTAKVLLNIGEQFDIDIDPTPLPPTTTTETSKIQFPNTSIQAGELMIYNIYGQAVEKRDFFKDAQKQLWNLQQNELSAGIYFYVKRTKGSNKIIESGKIIAVRR